MKAAAQELVVRLIVQAVRTAIETVRDIQLDGAQCDPAIAYRTGWVDACERLLAELKEE